MLARPIFLLLNLLGISLLGISLSSTLWADETITPPTKQSFYKWIDGKGVTHYSVTPPSPKEIAKKIKKVQTDVPAKKITASAPTTPITQTPTPTAAPTEPHKPLTTPANARPDLNAERDQSCQSAQKNLQTLQEKPLVYEKTKDGLHHFLTDAERQEQIKKSQQFIKDNC